jgi:glycosyltransferase involved in cell wall biosynthesis
VKIVQLLPELNEGGVERGTVELSRELVKRGFDSTVISAGGKLVERIERDGGKHITFDVCSKNPLSVPLRIAKLRRILEELRPDIVHARSRVPAWLTYFANKSLGIPFITTVHGFNSVSAYSAIMTKGDRVICVSNAVRDYIVEHYDVDIDKIVVIPRGVDTDVFSPDSVDKGFMEAFKKRYELDGAFVVSVVGRVTQLKDLESFIDAIALLAAQRPDIKGLIVGGVRDDKRHYFDALQERVRKKGMQEHIVFTGSQQKVAEIYALSDVTVSSSKKPESFGRSVAEAIAMNTPVVATRHGGVLDIVREGEHGFFYDVGDAVALAKAVMKASTLRFDGTRYIRENFSLERMAERTVKVYEEAAK